MSATEVIEQFKTLPSTEQAKVEAWFSEQSANRSEVRYIPEEMFQRAEDHVFQHYGTLLEQLAK